MTLLALVFASAGASARADVSPKPHVGTIDVTAAICIEAHGLASAEGHQGNWDAAPTGTSDVPHAAKGAAGVVHPALKLPGAANTVNHIFGKAAHHLGGLVTRFGSPEAAYTALYDATSAAVRAQGTTGLFQTAVKVAGETVTVRGNVIDGVVRISTAFIP